MAQEPYIQVSPTVRVEAGPCVKTAIATPELLDDEVTLSHYREGAPDKLGKKIVLGEEMTYADWKGEYEWKVYKLESREETISDKELSELMVKFEKNKATPAEVKAIETGTMPVERYHIVGAHPTKEAALAQAKTL